MPSDQCRVISAECRVPGAECRVPSAECRVPGAGCRVPSAECRVISAECRVPSAGCRVISDQWKSLLVFSVHPRESSWSVAQKVPCQIKVFLSNLHNQVSRISLTESLLIGTVSPRIMRLHRTAPIIVALIALCMSSCDGQFRAKEVAMVEATVPVLEDVKVSDSEKFLNDLKLSPYWKVERDRDGTLLAKARSIGPEHRFGDGSSQFLFEFMQDKPKELGKLRICNDYLRGDDVFSSFSAIVVFRALPKSGVTQIKSGEKASVPVQESYDSKIGPNSGSQVAVSLSDDHNVFLVVYEQGSDPKRTTTWKKLPGIVRELKGLASLPKEYLAVDQYSDLFSLLFPDTQPDHRVQRLPGMQDRDTFYGFLKPAEEWNLEGINIKISHPVYCGGECTRESSRKRKAEFLGAPSNRDRERLFFLIEDNAVYLKHPYDADFGTFSGTKSFEGTLEIIDGGGKSIVTTKNQFKGWER